LAIGLDIFHGLLIFFRQKVAVDHPNQQKTMFIDASSNAKGHHSNERHLSEKAIEDLNQVISKRFCATNSWHRATNG
jgi:hypothetical protein